MFSYKHIPHPEKVLANLKPGLYVHKYTLLNSVKIYILPYDIQNKYVNLR